MRGFFTALAFLTRLAPARLGKAQDLAEAMAWLPAVGLVLGGLLVAPLALGLFSATPWVQAWLLVIANLWATRGLHLDGLADVADGWGSGAVGQRFWEIVKDSRLGAFGAMGLLLTLTGQIVLLHELLARQAFAAAAFIFVAGRLAAVLLAMSARELARPGLGQLFVAGATPRGVLLAVGMTLVPGLILVSPLTLLAMLATALAPAMVLRGLARRQSGLNGDFLGAAIVLGETAACLGWLLVN
jgi:adenosylcobinamide-GDP ribazoletransferase